MHVSEAAPLDSADDLGRSPAVAAGLQCSRLNVEAVIVPVTVPDCGMFGSRWTGFVAVWQSQMMV
jgi:hypothetical protein